MTSLAIALLLAVHSGSAKSPALKVFGVEMGSSPRQMTRRFGKGVGEVRHYWDATFKEYSRDDGWDWWYWPEGKAFVQVYWSPAYPVSARRIQSVTICEPFGKPPFRPMMRPSQREIGWLEGLAIGLPEPQVLKKLTARLGKPTIEHGSYVWTVKSVRIEACFFNSRLAEIFVS